MVKALLCPLAKNVDKQVSTKSNTPQKQKEEEKQKKLLECVIIQ